MSPLAQADELAAPAIPTLCAEFVWLRNGWDAEIPRGVHRHGGHRSAGDFLSAFVRILDGRYIRWYPEFDSATGLPKRDANGRYVMYRTNPWGLDDPDDWLMPCHEAVKRCRGRGPKPPLEYLVLREALGWSGYCSCAHPHLLEHLAAFASLPVAEVAGMLGRVSRKAARIVGVERDASVPQMAV